MPESTTVSARHFCRASRNVRLTAVSFPHDGLLFPPQYPEPRDYAEIFSSRGSSSVPQFCPSKSSISGNADLPPRRPSIKTRNIICILPISDFVYDLTGADGFQIPVLDARSFRRTEYKTTPPSTMQALRTWPMVKWPRTKPSCESGSLKNSTRNLIIP